MNRMHFIEVKPELNYLSVPLLPPTFFLTCYKSFSIYTQKYPHKIEQTLIQQILQKNSIIIYLKYNLYICKTMSF